MSARNHTKWSLLVLFIAVVAVGNAGATPNLTGTVVDELSQPIPRVSLVIHMNDSVLTGTASDDLGNFVLDIGDNPQGVQRLLVSAVGYKSVEFTRVELSTELKMEIVLSRQLVVLPSVSVRGQTRENNSALTINSDKIRSRTSGSLIPSNITGAIVAPSVQRAGSQHSSKLRIQGTSPEYLVNGVNVGRDPNHFGTFTFIPAAIIDRVELKAQGTSVEHAQPAVVILTTPDAFNQRPTGEISLSVVEATGSFALGNDRVFALGSLRKSVLDKLVKHLDMKSDRRTLPPTNFQDVYVSSGLRLSNRTRLTIDQYHVRDFLSYVAEVTSRNSAGIAIFQHKNEHMLGARFEYVGERSLHRASVSGLFGDEAYFADPGSSADLSTSSNLKLDLAESFHRYQSSWETRLLTGQSEWTFGAKVDFLQNRDCRMAQSYWNFQPPDAGSDVPLLYHQDLNRIFEQVTANQSYTNSSGYFSYRHESERSTKNIGVRWDRFGALASQDMLSIRGNLTLQIGDNSSLDLFAGNFAASPIDKILEKDQVLIRKFLDELTPVRTWQYSAHFSNGPVKIGLSSKQISSLPILTPDFAQVTEDAGTIVVGDEFLKMKSSGSAHFVGADATIDLNNLGNGRFDLYAFYNYTHAVRTTDNVEIPHEMNSPHRFLVKGLYRPGGKLTLGADFSISSGRAYSEVPANVSENQSVFYSREFYQEYLGELNSQRFPTNISLDLHLSFDFGRSDIFLNVANATNHANAIVNSADGFIYDAGILPSIGYRLEF